MKTKSLLSKLRLDQHGFDHIFLGVAFIVLFGLAGAFYYVYLSAATNAPFVNANGYCLDNYADLKRLNNRVQLYACNESNAQKWTTKSDGTITNMNGYCLNATGLKQESLVTLTACNGKGLQKWSVQNSDGTIRNVASGLCLDNYADLARNENTIWMYACNNTNAQKWTQKEPTPTVVINAFTLTPSTIQTGGTARLNWTTTGSKGCTITPGGPVDTTSTTWTTPAQTSAGTKNFTLTCKDASGRTVGKTVALVVTAVVNNPPTTTSKVLIGACPIASEGGSVNDLVAKWGSGVSQRSFTNENQGWKVASRPVGVSHVHHSWKPPLGQPITDQQIIENTVNLKNGDFVTLWHETPVKIRNGSFTAAQGKQSMAMQNDFHARIVRLREAKKIPHLYTVFVDAAWMWESKSLYPGTVNDPTSAAYWGQNINADYIGIDTDAYANLTKYPDFTIAVRNVQAFIKAYPKFKGWTVPEIMHPRISSDPTGAQRAAWIKSQVAMMKSQPMPPKAIHLFDTNHRPNQVFPVGSPEHAAWRALVKESTL